jgi:hypothetical protein
MTDNLDLNAKTTLTEEQAATLEALSRHTPAILRRFDKILSEYGINRRVHTFTTAPPLLIPAATGADDLVYQEAFQEAYPTGWVCCACPPPDEAPAGKCAKCPPPDAGAPDAGPPVA